MYGHPSNTYPYCTDKWYKILRVSNSSGKLESLFPEEFKIVFISRIALVGIEKDALFITGYLLWIYSEMLLICYQSFTVKTSGLFNFVFTHVDLSSIWLTDHILIVWLKI